MGRVIKEKIEDYRAIDRLSYSALKQFEKDRKKFKLIYVDKDPVAIKKDKEEKDKSDYIRMGNIVDVILTDRENFHDYFIETSAEKPSGQMLILCDELFKITISNTKDGVVQTSFEDRFEKAYESLKQINGGKLRDSIEKFAENFEKLGKEYFNETIRSFGKTVITSEESVLAEKIVESLKNANGTKDVVNADGLTKFPILFQVGENLFKMEADKIIIDHSSKTIFPYDIKVSSFVEAFVWDSYLDKRYYIQAGLYKYGIEQWKKNTEFKDYSVENVGFIVADQNNYYEPLLYKTSDDHYEQAWNGFMVGNKKYKGIIELLNSLNETIENNCWNISIDNFKKGGKIYVPSFKNLEE
jgi:hypothetical protein